MKKMAVASLVAIGLFLIIHGFSAPSMAAEPFKKTLKFAAALPEASFFGKHFKWWAGEVENRTQGRVKAQIFWLESLVKAKDMLPAIQSGFTDMGWVIGIYFPSNFPLYMMLDHSSNCNADHYRAAMLAGIETAEKEPSLKAEIEREKVFIALPYTSGQAIVGTKKCWDSFLDIKGKTVRTAGGIRAQYFANLGANPVFMTMPDCYEALDRGTVSGVGDTPPSLILSFKLHEIAKCWYKNDPGIAMAAGVFMNLDTFRSFPKDIQETILKLRMDYLDRFSKDLMEFERDFYQDLKTKHGVRFVELSPEERKINMEAGNKANEELIKKQEAAGHKSTRAVYNYYRTALEKYEAEMGRK